MSSYLDEILNTFVPVGALTEQMNYCLFSGGKRLRMKLCLETSKMADVDQDNAQRLACAIEFIHTYSLIHDDLPCMDNDDFRRGKPSCHKQFGEAQAVLCGDALLNLAFEVLLGGVGENYFRAARYVAVCAGAKGMIGGQFGDLFDKCDALDKYVEICRGKTCGLIRAAICAPLIAAGADEEIVAKWRESADCFGEVFQIADDLTDDDVSENSVLRFMSKDDAKRLLKEKIASVRSSVAAELQSVEQTLQNVEKLAF